VYFLHWLEAISLIGKVPEGIRMVRELPEHLLYTLPVSVAYIIISFMLN
jgi:hypothetical protein